MVDTLTKQLTHKDEQLDILEKRIQTLEEEVDCQEQYSRRPNLRIQGIPEETNGTTEQKVLLLINETMGFTPPLALTDVERAHRIGPPKDKEGRPRKRPIIVRFRAERLRDSVFRARSKLKEHNQGHPDARIFMNEDLTAHGASLAFKTRLLKRQQKINDCWTTGDKVVVKDLSKQIRQVTSSVDLDKYYTLEHRLYPAGTPSATLRTSKCKHPAQSGYARQTTSVGKQCVGPLQEQLYQVKCIHIRFDVSIR